MSNFYEIDDIQFCDNTAEEARAAKAEVEKIVAATQARVETLEGKLALCLMKLSELDHEGYADTIAEDVFETWQEIRHKAGRA